MVILVPTFPWGTFARDVQELLADLEARLAAAAGLVVAMECRWMLVLSGIV